MQPDTVIPDPSNPQSWSRYLYVLNNPLKFTDPSGHREIISNENGKLCFDILQCSGLNIKQEKLKSYSAREKKILRDLLNTGNSDASNTVEYLINHGGHIRQEETPNAAARWKPFTYDIFIDPSSSSDYPYLLSLIVHETIHIQQFKCDFCTVPNLTPVTVSGELIAWQAGFQVYKDITGELPGNQLAAQTIMGLKPFSDIDAIRRAMKQFSPSYNAQYLLPW